MESLKSNGKFGAYLGIFSVILIWGISPVLTSYMFDYYSACIYSSIVSLFSAICLMMFVSKNLKELRADYFKIAIPTGLFNSLASLLQKIGLNYTTPTSYAFLENLSCITVPVLLFILIKKKPNKLTVLSCVLCLIGAYVLSGMGFFSGFKMGIGEILCSLAGVFYGVNIAVTGVHAKRFNASLYVMIQMFVSFIFSALVAVVLNFVPINSPIEPIKFTFALQPILALILIAIIINAICWTVRTKAMKKVSPVAVAIVMPLSAVVTGVVSVIVGKDSLSPRLILGGVIILVATIISGIADKDGNETK